MNYLKCFECVVGVVAAFNKKKQTLIRNHFCNVLIKAILQWNADGHNLYECLTMLDAYFIQFDSNESSRRETDGRNEQGKGPARASCVFRARTGLKPWFRDV